MVDPTGSALRLTAPLQQLWSATTAGSVSCVIVSLGAVAESMVPRNADHCNLCEEESTHGVLSVENNQRT
jgi:hypothetical protein